jgi:hypothetical protein
MRDRKLIRILSRMEVDERKEFAEFLRSPLHSHRPKLGEMVQLMETMLFQQPDDIVSNEDYYQAVYPGKVYDANNLNRLISVIFKELKDYLAFLHYRKDDAAKHVYTLREYASRKWADLTFSGMKEARMRLDTEIPEGEDFYYQHYQVGKIEGQYWVENMPKKPGLIYQPALDRLDEFFVLAKAKYSVLALNHDQIHSSSHQFSFEETIEAKYDSQKITGLLPHLFQQIYLIKKSKDSEESLNKYISSIKQLIPYYDSFGTQITPGKLISRDDSELLYGMGFNHASEFRHMKGNSWVPITTEILSEAITKGVFLIKGKLSGNLFSNQIKLLCVTGFADMALEFHQNFRKLLADDQFAINSDTALSLIYYFQKKFNSAHQILLNLKSRVNLVSSQFLEADGRMLLCLTWYRLDEIDQMIYEINAFRALLSRIAHTGPDKAKSNMRFCSAMLSLERIIRGKPQLVLPKLKVLREKVSSSRINGGILIIEILDEVLNNKGPKPTS